MTVADGVGGWAESGVNPAIYSRKLCKNIKLATTSDLRKYEKDTAALVKYSWENNQELGSSTLVVVTLPSQGKELFTTYVGDSGYCILRRKNPASTELNIVYESKAQQKGFNFPLQLGCGQNGDHPEVGKTQSHEVQTGDFVVLGSDGLFDNINAAQIADLISRELAISGNAFQPFDAANKIAKQAFQYSLDPKYDSPFAQEARKNKVKFMGGKSDDISVTIGIVELSSN